MNDPDTISPRILILETDRKTAAAVRRYAVKGWAGASVQSNSATLADVARAPGSLRSFDVVLAGCDFSEDGSTANPVFRALRAISADPENPAVILLTHGGSEYTAVQAIKAGAFDYIPRMLFGREQMIAAVQNALARRQSRGAGDVTSVVQLFGYDVRRCLSRRDNVSVHVAYSAERAAEVVLKVLHRDRGSLSRDVNFERFVEEFKLLYDIEDPGVAEIYDFRVTSQYCYIAMEYFRAGHLGGRIGRALDVRDALRYGREIAKALAVVHAAGIVHRDLKPGNVMLRDDGSVALIDFGISQSAHRPAGLGRQPAISGTPYYMSPEQARGEPTDERTDLYALGVILYQLLTGEKPYVGASAEEILERHCSAPIPRLPPELGHVQPVLDRLLAKNADQRLPTAREVIEAIEAAREAPPATLYAVSARSA
ncbi:MAG TPA: protein kinase [Gammaproteobacteria bacterium]